MKEKGVLFNTDMVRAILAGNKTVTRRPIKKQPPTGLRWIGWILSSTMRKIEGCAFWGESSWAHEGHYARPPYEVGDILYVRETWWKGDLLDDNGNFIERGITLYRADEPNIPSWGTDEYEFYKWSPSIHMPREAARLFLRVTRVRVERLQEITEEGARAEGFEPIVDKSGAMVISAVGMFRAAWTAIYGVDNSWVWVYEFERAENRG